jgi:filamentous hemagglutinin
MSTQRKPLCGARVFRSHCVARPRKPAWLPGSALCALTASFTVPATAGNLPVPCIAAGSCGVTGPATWVSSGNATATQTANQLTVNQTSQNAILNWQSFNIGSGSSVNFVQPNSTALAINNIFQGNPSQIFGSLTANGRIYLINQNGIMFGAGSQVNVGGLVASSLNITQNAITNGIAQTITTGDQTTPSFVPFTDASGNPLTSGSVTVAQGASLQSNGGQILLFAPNVTNQGTISTPNGQTVLAAGTSVYLATSNDASVRGITVAVDGAGTVTNGDATNATVTDPTKLIGQIVASHGNVTLMGLAVNQQGLISANTSVEENGTIMLIAANHTQGGTLTVGPNSVTEAGLDLSDTSVAVDATVQQKSAVTLQGANVDVLGGSSIIATSGSVTITGTIQGVQGSTDNTAPAPNSTSDGSRIYIADDASIDVSGAIATLPMSANSLEVELRGSELEDDPNQRNGALRGQTVTVDVRQYGTLDGTSWVGTPLADLSADFATIQRGIQQRNETGGTVTLQSSGDVIVGSNAKINVSGGATDYQSGYLNTSALLGANGQVYSISNASPNVVYTGVANTNVVSLTDLRWGVTSTYVGIYGTGQGQYVPGYVQGANAGTLTVNAPHVLLDGQLVANVEVGPYQRNPQVANTTQEYDQLPLPGTLDLGAIAVGSGGYPDLVLTSIDVAAGPILPSLRNADGTPFNPLTDPWPASLTEAMLNPDLIGANAAGRIQLYANDTITVPSNVDLQLPIGGSFSATASNINIAGTIAGPGASVTLQTEPTIGNPQVGPSGITLEPTAVINVAGAWVNDNPALTPEPATAPLPLNGGSVIVAARDGSVTLSTGAVIDVSGGAQEQASGTLTAGGAGSISISTSQPDQIAGQLIAPTNLTLGATLRGYGVDNGGSLSISASSFCLTGGAACAPQSANQTATGMVTLAPDFFTTGGFGSYSLTANFGGLELTSGTRLNPVQENFILPANTLMPSASTLSAVAPVGLLPGIQREPVDVALATQYVSPGSGNAVTAAEFATASNLSLDKGASIKLDPLAKVSLTSNTSILDDGTISSSDGSVSMTVTASLGEVSFIAGHQLWLGPDSVINVSGTVQAVTNDLGQTQGSVLPGGSVTLTADRGAVEALPGSFINVSGTTGTLDIQQVQSNGATTFVPTAVASAGGSVSIQAAEAILLSGTMSAASGSPTTVANGTFSLALDGNDRYLSSDFPAGTLVGSNYPITPREIEIANTQAPVVIAAGTDLPDGLDGQALVSASALASAGFDSIKLSAPSLNNSVASLSLTNPAEMVAGEIVFNGNVSLGAGRSLTLDAASFLSAGGTTTLSAPYVSLGQSQVKTQGTVGATNSGTGVLTVNGALIDLVGNAAFGGFSQVTLDSTGDIRANGVVPLPGNTLALQSPGALTVSGELDLVAQQVYPSTLTAYSFTAGAGGSGDINIKQAGGAASSTLLSAGGSLTFNAADINQDGTVRAPLGSIAMNATNITLGDGSTTSTSTDGQTIPFGTTQGGFDWVYPLYGSSGSLVYGTDGIPLPTQSIQLSGTSVNVAKGATIDVKGGGDLLATEFVPGTTGTVDVLGGTGSFAIIPTSDLQFAPNDPYYTSGSGVFAGESVYLAGGGGIPAGTYAVLPAR